ncbi:MAG: universal stress protein [Candidatus Promineifilaceae bacterium]
MENFSEAVQDFYHARSQAALREILGRLTGRSTELLSYEDVRQKVRASGVVSRSLQEIPVDAIIGSVGRYNDFTRDFLPRLDSDQNRWAKVKVAINDLTGVPPVELYKIGDIYFVHDGHHRISVARQLGNTHVQAYVTEIRSKVPLSPDIEPDDLILKAEYADFLETTHLDQLRPEADLSVTVPGQYQKLLEHIEVHRYYMGIEEQREIPYEEAVVHWYDFVYQPVVDIIREQGILDDFPNRTETDLYLWIGKRREDIKDELGWEIPPSSVVADLASQFSSRLPRVMARIGQRVLDIVIPDELDSGPQAGAWRKERLSDRADKHLFNTILVPVSGNEPGWTALEVAYTVAKREDSEVHGLHVLLNDLEGETAEKIAIRDRFYWRRGEVGFRGEFHFQTGNIIRTICDQARWADLVAVKIDKPPEPGLVGRLGSDFRTLVRRCSRPILATPGVVTPLSKAILAYDSTPKAEEALFIATYLSGCWQMPLDVISVSESKKAAKQHLNKARSYLEEHGVEANYIAAKGPVAETILKTAENNGCDWLIIGGYNLNPLVEAVLGTVLNEIIHETKIPLLICQ